jgi:hypothetical protein
MGGQRRKKPPKTPLTGAMNLWDEILARIETKVNRHASTPGSGRRPLSPKIVVVTVRVPMPSSRTG